MSEARCDEVARFWERSQQIRDLGPRIYLERGLVNVT